ncbi:MAG: pyruvate carboxyltransferase [Desulfobulbaceae bacterium]|nr:pyruvate carboxyltransferase [Desulfobulbaceae bacterium]
MKGLVDSTLREGAQSVGVHFNRAEKIRIIELLVKIGIEEIELGLASDKAEIADLLASCRNTENETRFAIWCRCRADDVRAATELRPDVLSLSVPSSDLHLERRLHRNRQWAIDSLRAAIEQARAANLPYISVGLEDASRADPKFLAELADTATTAGADRLRLADTVGTCNPTRIQEMVSHLREQTHLAIGIHAHNDFGMATANTITALTAGADWGDVSILGLGERAGMAKLEEVAGFLSLHNHHRSYRVELLKAACKIVSDATQRIIQPHHPIIGEAIFTCETGLHLQGLLREPSTYEPFDPQLVGSKRQLLFGTKIGQGAVEGLLANHQQSATPLMLQKITSAIREHAKNKQRPLTAGEIISPSASENAAKDY